MDCSPLGSSVHTIFQAGILEWVAISYSRESSQARDRTCFSCVTCIGRWILYHLSHKGSPRILEWVVCAFSSRSSRPRNRIRVSCIAGGFFLLAELSGKPQVCTAAAAESLQSCLTLCDHIDGSPPGSSVPGILQARILEWVAISYSP